MTEKVTVYDIDFNKEFFKNLEDQIDSIDPSRNYGKKHTVKQACKIASYLLEEKYSRHQATLDQLKREINDLEEVLDK